MSTTIIRWLRQCVEDGAFVLLSDPGRAYVPREGWIKLASYNVPTSRDIEDKDTRTATVWRMEKTQNDEELKSALLQNLADRPQFGKKPLDLATLVERQPFGLPLLSALLFGRAVPTPLNACRGLRFWSRARQRSRAVFAQELLHAADREALIIKKLLDVVDDLNVFRTIIPASAAAL